MCQIIDKPEGYISYRTKRSGKNMLLIITTEDQETEEHSIGDSSSLFEVNELENVLEVEEVG